MTEPTIEPASVPVEVRSVPTAGGTLFTVKAENINTGLPVSSGTASVSGVVVPLAADGALFYSAFGVLTVEVNAPGYRKWTATVTLNGSADLAAQLTPS